MSTKKNKSKTKMKAPSSKDVSPVTKHKAKTSTTSPNNQQAASKKVIHISSRSGSGPDSNKKKMKPARSGTSTGTGIDPAVRQDQATEQAGGGLQQPTELGQPSDKVLAEMSSRSKIDSSCNDDETGEDNEILHPTLDSAIELHQPDLEDAQEIAKTARLELDRQIIELRTKGCSYTEIQKELKINRRTIARCLKRFIKETRNQLGMKNVTHAEIQGKIFQYAPEAVDQIIKLSRRAKKEDTRMKASADLLDRAGFVPVQKTLNLHAVEQMSRDELKSGFASLIQRVKERNTENVVAEIKPSDGGLEDVISP